MAIIQLQRPQTALESMGGVVQNLLETVTQLRIQQGQRKINMAVNDVIARGGSPQELAQAINSVYDQQSGSNGIVERIVRGFNPNAPLFTGQSDVENYIQKAAVQRAFEDPLDRDYRQARVNYYDSLTKNRMREEPLPSTEIKRHKDAMDLMLENLKSTWHTRGTEYSAKNVQNAWQQYSDAYGIENYKPFEQNQLMNIFTMMVKEKSDGASDWQPGMIETADSRQQTPAEPDGMVVPKELEPYWRDMTEQEHREAITYLRNGGDPQKIIRLLSR